MRRVAWIALFTGSAALLIVALIRTYDRLPRDVFHVRWGYAAAAIGVIAAANTASAVVWSYVLRGQGLHVSSATSIRILSLSQLAKYIPGGIWQPIGWLEFARRSGISRGAGGLSILLQMSVMVAGALIVGPVLLAIDGSAGAFIWLLLVVPAVLVALHPRVLDRLIALVSRMLHRTLDLPSVSFPRLLGGVGMSVPIWLGYGGALVLAVESLNLAFADRTMLLGGAFAVAWAVGFLALPVPGGLAVREAVLMLILRGGGVSTAEAAAIAIASRLYFVAAEGLMALVALTIPKPSAVVIPDESDARSVT